MQKVLVITYYWPPAGGPGVQRWLKFAKYLPENGLEPIVYVPENAQYPIVDESLLDEMPEIRVLRKSIFEPYRFASWFSRKQTTRISSGVITPKAKQSWLERILLWIRGNFFIPDARRFWVGPSVRFLGKVIAEEGIKKVITTGPPHSVHLIGLKLKKAHDLEWIADFRDPWTTIGYHNKLKLGKYARTKHLQLEKQVLTGADKLLVTSPHTQRQFQQKTSRPIKVITNGYDGAYEKAALDKEFTLSHIGSLLTGRNPKNLWAALQALCEAHEDFKRQLKIQLAGVVNDEVLQSLTVHNLKDHVVQLGYLPHHEVLQVQRSSQVLVLLEINTEETKGIIPGKLFEYLNARRPILAIGPNGWEATEIIEATQSGRTFSYGEEEALKTVLLSWYKAFNNGGLAVDAQGIEKYSRAALTQELAKYVLWESS